MPAKNPRINVLLEKPVFTSVSKLASKEHVSLSMKVRDLVIEALELREDVALAEVAESREKTFNRKTAFRHNEVW